MSPDSNSGGFHHLSTRQWDDPGPRLLDSRKQREEPAGLLGLRSLTPQETDSEERLHHSCHLHTPSQTASCISSSTAGLAAVPSTLLRVLAPSGHPPQLGRPCPRRVRRWPLWSGGMLEGPTLKSPLCPLTHRVLLDELLNPSGLPTSHQ